ncbi:MAG: hypothetical protein DI536_04355 [Archangium gephyra]|uniref:PD-(D/E)XK endonuclease-like domain-containing protein n=1 Tax=Archangium gephyra TaxID=48 RepID=A0A2W5TSH1_9BACT|nr:MAG: hypothetical protein DI536_04355 [Archangium gephyra]
MASISTLPRLEACPTSEVLQHIDDAAGPYAAHGTAVHAYLDAIAKGATQEQALADVPEEHREACAGIDLDQVPHSQAGGWASEVAVALDYEADTARVLEGVVNRQYRELGATEIAGTADLVSLVDEEDGGVTVVVLDVKTGRRWLGRPEDHLQLLGYARAFALAYGATRARVGWLYVHDDETPRLVMGDVDEFALDAAGARIRDAMNAVAWLRDTETHAPKPGDHCTYCPAYRGCPAHTAMVKAFLSNSMDVARGGALGVDGPLPVIRAEDLPVALDRVKAVIDLAERVKKEIEDAVRAVGRVELPNDRVLTEVWESREKIDAEKARPILVEEFGDAANDEIEVKTSFTKAALKRLAQGRASRTKERIGELEAAVMKRIRAVEGVTTSGFAKVAIVKRAKAGGA